MRGSAIITYVPNVGIKEISFPVVGRLHWKGKNVCGSVQEGTISLIDHKNYLLVNEQFCCLL